MPSPFPGMNPYLERATVWDDFQMSFVVGLREELVRVAPPEFRVRIEEHRFLHERLPPEETSAPTPEYRYGPGRPTDADRVPAPVTVTVGVVAGDFRLPYLAIYRRWESQPVCVIDVLSPFLKHPGPDRDQHWYRVRCDLVRMAGYVELDLLRGGLRMPWLNLPACDYSVVVSPYSLRPRALTWALGVKDRLPVIPVPLRPELPDLSVDLQAVFDRVYDAAGYARYVHAGDPIPPLTPEDAAWARALVPAAGG